MQNTTRFNWQKITISISLSQSSPPRINIFLHTTMVDVIDGQGLQLVCLGVLLSSK